MGKVHTHRPFGRFFLPVILLSVQLLIPSRPVFSQTDPAKYALEITRQYQQSSGDSVRIDLLMKLAGFWYDKMGQPNRTDSISEKALEIARDSYRPSLLLFACNSYLECNDLSAFNAKALGYALEAVRLSEQSNNPTLEWQSCKNLVNVYLAGYKYDKALVNSYKALAIAGSKDNILRKSESYLLIGRSLDGQNQKIDAFRNYLTAVGLAEGSGNKTLLKTCYSQLSDFYNQNRMFDKAILYKLKQADLIRNEKTPDSLALMWTQYDLQVIAENSADNHLSESRMESLLDFALRNKDKRLENYQLSLFRSHLIKAYKITELYKLYHNRLPGELPKLARENPAMYCRLMAFFNEEANRPDSALLYFTRAENLMQSDPNKILKANFYHRFGQYFMRQGKKMEAIGKLLKSYELAREASYFEYMLDATEHLQTLYAGLGDYKNAYAYADLNRALADSINSMSRKDQLLTLEIDHEARQRERAAAVEQQETLRRHSLQYTSITIVIIGVFLLLMMLGSFRVPEWVIRMLGFFSFILFFEFIIMIADHKIIEITHDEPWQILLIKIGLIAFLLPFHHWIEKQVTHYLISHKLIDFSRISPRNILRKNKKSRIAADEIPA